MAIAEVLAQIDAEIVLLRQVKAILTGDDTITKPGRKPPRLGKETVSAAVDKKRNISPEGRARIAEAVKRRWAAQKTKQKGRG